MKKTIVAAAIAAVVAAPAAFAEVKISGFVSQEFTIDGDDTGHAEDGLEQKLASDINFSASEDLGNGMKASAKISMKGDNGTNTFNEQYVSLSGDFGTILGGRVETFNESKIHGMMSVDSSDALTIEVADNAVAGAEQDGVLAYVSPTWNGFHFAIAGVAAANGGSAESTSTVTYTAATVSEASGSVGLISGATSSGLTKLTGATITGTSTTAANTTDADDAFDATDILLAYSNGPLTVMVDREEVSKKMLNASNDQVSTGIAASYNMGDITLKAAGTDVQNKAGGANDAETLFVGATFTAGNNGFGIGYSEMDIAGSTSSDEENWIFDFNHKFSKNAMVFVTHANKETGGTDKAETSIGMKYAF
jgi:predicted porin